MPTTQLNSIQSLNNAQISAQFEASSSFGEIAASGEMGLLFVAALLTTLVIGKLLITGKPLVLTVEIPHFELPDLRELLRITLSSSASRTDRFHNQQLIPVSLAKQSLQNQRMRRGGYSISEYGSGTVFFFCTVLVALALFSVATVISLSKIFLSSLLFQ